MLSLGGARVMTPRESAQTEAEKTFETFMLWTKRVTMYAAIFLGIVVFGCNSGVETGKNKTGSQYNGEAYSPMNMNVKK
tara:strand:- start:542 stop:778 length:237 start_codon:yes stop_codon:yes gene_type:complete